MIVTLKQELEKKSKEVKQIRHDASQNKQKSLSFDNK